MNVKVVLLVIAVILALIGLGWVGTKTITD